MQYELVWIETKDKLELYGLLKEAKTKDKILINIHGTAGNFYEEDFIANFAEELPKVGISILSTNNRGAYVYDAYQKSGAATEKFEDCLIDIDTWIEFVLNNGYKGVVLSGHSLGAEKVVYYMTYGKYKNKVKAIILLGPADSYGSHRVLDGKDNTKIRKNVESLLEESKKLIANGKDNIFLNRYAYGSHEGIMPKSADSFVNFLGKGSKVVEALPFHIKRLDNYSKIRVPIIVIIGDQNEYTAIPIKDALELMKKENKLTQTVQLKNCNHDFEGKEEELAEIIKEFLVKNFKPK